MLSLHRPPGTRERRGGIDVRNIRGPSERIVQRCHTTDLRCSACLPSSIETWYRSYNARVAGQPTCWPCRVEVSWPKEERRYAPSHSARESDPRTQAGG